MKTLSSITTVIQRNNGNGPDSDPDGDTLTVIQVHGNTGNVDTEITLDSGALLTINSDGSLRYNPNGQFEDLIAGQRAFDTFTYTISDGNDGTDTATVTMVINGADDFLESALFDLSTLDGTNGFVINGIDADDNSGEPVSGLGDVNGDGFDDIIISAFGGDPNGNTDAGESYVIFGSNNGFASSLDLDSLDGTNGFVINGIDQSDSAGVSVSGAGDFNNDGIDDILIGAFGADPNSTGAAGETYVVFGNRDGFDSSLDLSDLDGNNGIVINGIDVFDTSGASVSNLGDINGDNIDDIIIGAELADPDNQTDAGESYVVFGSSNLGSSLNLSTLDGSNGFIIGGLNPSDRSGRPVSGAGDLNNDGLNDIIIGASSADPDGKTSAGESYVIFGSSTGFDSSFDLSTLDGSNGFTIKGIDPFDRSGGRVSDAGDVNGDGIDDVIISASFAFPDGKPNAGESYVIFGRDEDFGSTLELSDLDGNNGFVIKGVDPTDRSGISVSGAGDVNDDGIDDLIVGAFAASPTGASGAGESYVIYGSRDGFDSSFDPLSLDGSNGFVLSGIDQDDRTGISVSSAGDFNGDGVDDVIVGAFLADPNGSSNAGESYLVFGQSDNASPVANDDILFTDEDTAVTGNVLEDNGSGADSDADGDALTVIEVNGDAANVNTEITLASGALVTLNSDGTLLYDPNGQFDDLDTGNTAINRFNYTLSDGNGGTDIATVSISINGSDDLLSNAVFNLSNLDGSNGFVINGVPGDGRAGVSVNTAGDVNNDGFDDLVIGADFANSDGKFNSGESYVVFGGQEFNSGSLNLIDLDGDNGFVINGVDAGDRSGFSVNTAGDINDDGIADLLISNSADVNGISQAGGAYVIFGGQDFSSGEFNPADLDGSNGFTINGIDMGDTTGRAVSIAGDINGDDIDDLIISAPSADPNDNNVAGETYVVFGGQDFSSGSLNLDDLDGSNGFVINGIDPFDFSGHSISNAGDINDDGRDDVIISADSADPNGNIDAGESYVVFGDQDFGNGSLNLDDLDGSNGFIINGIDPGDNSGSFVSTAGDINNDGIADLIIGAPFADPNGESDAGETYIVFGGQDFSSGSFNLEDLDGSNGFVINGINAGDNSGFAVNDTGDVNGDGIDDVIIGANKAAPNGNIDAGETYVVFGGQDFSSGSFNLEDLDGNNGILINGIDIGDESGFSVSTAGDFNGDGVNDLIIGATGGGPGIFSAGESYVVFGQDNDSPALRFVIDNYIANASVFFDANNNTILDPDEPFTNTNGFGAFKLDIPDTFNPEDGQLIAFGGVDTSTGLPLETQIAAPGAATIITLLTTLVADLVNQGLSVEQANTLVTNALGIPSDVDLSNFDPILANSNGEPGGAETFAAMVQVQIAVTQTAGLLAGVTNTSVNDVLDEVIAAITNQIQANDNLDLSNTQQLETIIDIAATQLTVDVTDVVEDVAQVIGAANQRIDEITQTQTSNTFEEDFAKVQKVALGITTTDLMATGSGDKPISEVITAYTGTNLDTQIENAQVLSNAPVALSLSNRSIAENLPVGSTVGTFATRDPDTDENHTYSLVPGRGDTDNNAFEIVDNTLIAKQTFDFETQDSYNIRVQTSDGNGGVFARSLTINIRDVDETLDLVATDFDVLNDHVLGAKADINFTIANQGNGTLTDRSVDVDIIYSDDDIIGNDDDEVLDTLNVILGVDETASINETIDLPVDILYRRSLADDPTGLGSGHVSTSYDYLGVVIDPDNVISESNEANNADQGKGDDKDDITYFPWDIDGNGSVTPTDAIFVINRLGQSVSDENMRADFDGNGQITPTDAIASINRLGYGINGSVFEEITNTMIQTSESNQLF